MRLRPKWDNSVNLGHVLTIVVILTAMAGAYLDFRDRIITLETRVGPMWERFVRGAPVADAGR